jgi:Patatin-like phospholipase
LQLKSLHWETGMSFVTGLLARRSDGRRIKLRYFEDVLAVEFDAVDARRDAALPKRAHVDRLEPKGPSAEFRTATRPTESRLHSEPSPHPDKLFPPRSDQTGGERPPRADPLFADPHDPDHDKTRPRPVPCDATGLALSGGGIRSAAVCLGVLQALHRHRLIDGIDYLSTVSGGGYIGCCLSAAMSHRGGGAFPFGDDASDTPAVAHLRNYSNYLMPRGRSGIRNVSDVAAIILRGLLLNFIQVLAALLFCALLTKFAHPVFPSLVDESRLGFTIFFLCAVAFILIVWALLRSSTRFDDVTDDSHSWFLFVARFLIIASVVVAFLELQPHARRFLIKDGLLYSKAPYYLIASTIGGALIAFSIAISFLSGSLGRFLLTSQDAKDWATLARRGLAHFCVLVAAMVIPVALWLCYLLFSIWVIDESFPQGQNLLISSAADPYLAACFVMTLIAAGVQANAYSLHRLYRDRLSRAFLFPPERGQAQPDSLANLKLSGLPASAGPYHIINSAMNVQRSAEANRRGRNADFFMFTRDFIGSDLTLFAPTKEMEKIDSRIDLATAMAISGAAVSANMGARTVRLLSPTLALLNIRLGYWLRNPRDLAKEPNPRDLAKEPTWLLKGVFSRLIEKFYLLLEMLNMLDEKSRHVYLTDGGHIENLGVYELLKRGCQLIVVVDAEADPSMSFGSLMKLERYARIDFGVHVVLPFEQIARMTKPSLTAWRPATSYVRNVGHTPRSVASFMKTVQRASSYISRRR